MNKILIAVSLLCLTMVQADAKARYAPKPKSSVTVWNQDSADPEVGWHNEPGGGRVCSHDCDNPEIPGSGAVCRDVVVMGMKMRDCVTN